MIISGPRPELQLLKVSLFEAQGVPQPRLFVASYRLSWCPDSLRVEILLEGDKSDEGSALRLIPEKKCHTMKDFLLKLCRGKHDWTSEKQNSSLKVATSR